jgi:hypothetical protein
VRESIIAFNRGREGVYTVFGALNIRCCDVYGNEGGNYGGATPDQAGTYNISADPLFCGLEEGDFHLDATSPAFTPPHASCGSLMGALGARCGDAPDLRFTRVKFEAYRAEAGRSIGVTAVVCNEGTQPAPEFALYFAAQIDLPPVPGVTWLSHTVAEGLAAGDSSAWSFEISAPEPDVWEAYLSIDPEHLVPELDREDNVQGPITIMWTAPAEGEQPSTGLREIRPNPFSGTTRIEYALSQSRSALIEIYDLAGRRVKVWKLPPAGPGIFSIEWGGADDGGNPLASGVYFCRFTAGALEQSAKIVLIR